MKFFPILLAVSASIALASCGQGDILYADNAMINLSPVDDNPSAGYLDLHGGRVDTALVGVTADDVVRLEMHETVEADGMARMQTVKSIAIPAGETVKMEPGGKHLMIWGISESARKRGTMPLTLIYANDDRILVIADIKPAGSGD